MTDSLASLFQPATVRGMHLKNRIVLSPMCTYSATDGMPNDGHLTHLAMFARGGFSLLTIEATAVEERGRISYGDLGIWSDRQIEPFLRITRAIHNLGAKASLQLGHAGRKASMQRPWQGHGPLNAADLQAGEVAWDIVGVTDEAIGEGWLVPHQLSVPEIHDITAAYGLAAKRAIAAGFDAIEIHAAHGYLLHTFLSPLTNKRTDRYGGDLAGRMRFLLEVLKTCREAVPDHVPVFVKVSAVDNTAGGSTVDDTVALAAELRKLGADVITCSSRGLSSSPTASPVRRTPGYQVPYAREVKTRSSIMTMAVGMILDARMAAEIIASGSADFVAIGRQALFDPFWPLHELNRYRSDDTRQWESWPQAYGWWLRRWEGLSAQNCREHPKENRQYSIL